MTGVRFPVQAGHDSRKLEHGNQRDTADGLKMSDPNGNSYDAKFDGKDDPIQGDPGHTMVSLKRIGNDTIEETDWRGLVRPFPRLAI
jgi:hypothetical protein